MMNLCRFASQHDRLFREPALHPGKSWCCWRCCWFYCCQQHSISLRASRSLGTDSNIYLYCCWRRYWYTRIPENHRKSKYSKLLFFLSKHLNFPLSKIKLVNLSLRWAFEVFLQRLWRLLYHRTQNISIKLNLTFVKCKRSLVVVYLAEHTSVCMLCHCGPFCKLPMQDLPIPAPPPPLERAE